MGSRFPESLTSKNHSRKLKNNRRTIKKIKNNL